MNAIDSINNRVGMRKSAIDEEISKGMSVIDISNVSDEEKKEALEKLWSDILKKN